jgi:hypothetical protein
MLSKETEDSWIERLRTEKILHTFEEARKILHTLKRNKANWMGHILRRNCLLNHVIEEEM